MLWKDNVLSDFLKAHRAEVKEVMLTEYNEKDHITHEKNLSKAEGIAESVIQLLTDGSDIPDDLRDKILQETNIEKLRQWLKAAAKASSVPEFRQFTDL